ncbi:MAG: tetratricopeptide repeat protein [Acidobacteriota bacterium]
MSRRLAFVAVFVALVALVALFVVDRPETPTAPTGPRSVERAERSVFLITVDTTRPDRLGPYGSQDVATPVLDRLASRGVTFERASAVAPITLVAHTSILSGRYPFDHGVRNNGMQYVSEDVTTLAEVLKDEGYRTAAFVSAAVLDRRYGLDQGFEVYDDDLSERRNLSPRMVADRTAEATVARTRAWLDTLDEDEKFFVWVHFYDPHASYSPPAPFRDQYRDRLYDGEIAYMDHEIGQLLRHPRALGSSGSGDSTDAPIVTVIGDHGESLGEHGERTHAILAYDSTLHIPWILHVPGGPAGLRIPEPVGQVDVLPTMLSLLDLQHEDEAVAGRDLVPVIEGLRSGGDRAYYSETYLPFYTYGWAKLRVLRSGRWKWIEAPEPELYDLVRDPRELTDLHGQHTDVAHDMQRDLTEWLERYGSDREASLDLDSEAVAQLRSLGYLSVGSGRQDDGSDRPNPMAMIDQHVGLERARMFLADRLYTQAGRQLESVLRRDPNNLAAMLDLVRALEGQGELDRAVEVGERALNLDPEYTQTIMMMARLEAQRDDLTRALDLARLAAERDPNNPDVKIQQAGFLQRLGRHEEVATVLDATLEQHADHPRTNAMYAHWVEARRGDLPAAEARLKKALERDPFLSQGWFFLGRLQERARRWADAEASFRRGLQGRPDDADLHGALGHLMARLGRQVDAVSQLREAIRLSTTMRTELHVSLGAMLAEMGRFEEAQKEYDKVLALQPSHPGARNNAAIALYRSGRLDEAREALAAIVEEFPRHADAHNNLAAIAIDQRHWADAVVHSRRTLELAPELIEAWNNLGIALEETGKSGEAREAYEKTLTLDPEYWPAYFNLGYLLAKTGDHDDAVAAFDEVLTRVPNHGETHLELGSLYAGPLADPAKARIHWNAFLRHAPNHPRLEEIRRRLAAL